MRAVARAEPLRGSEVRTRPTTGFEAEPEILRGLTTITSSGPDAQDKRPPEIPLQQQLRATPRLHDRQHAQSRPSYSETRRASTITGHHDSHRPNEPLCLHAQRTDRCHSTQTGRGGPRVPTGSVQLQQAIAHRPPAMSCSSTHEVVGDVSAGWKRPTSTISTKR